MVKRNSTKTRTLVTDAISNLNCRQGFTAKDVLSFISTKYGNIGDNMKSIYTAIKRQVNNGILKLTGRQYYLTSGTSVVDLTQESMSDLWPGNHDMTRRRACKRRKTRRKRTTSRRRKTRRSKSRQRPRKRKSRCVKRKGKRATSRGRKKRKIRKRKKSSKRKNLLGCRRRVLKQNVQTENDKCLENV